MYPEKKNLFFFLSNPATVLQMGNEKVGEAYDLNPYFLSNTQNQIPTLVKDKMVVQIPE